MHCPENGIYILLGETSIILTTMRRCNPRWSSHVQQEEEQDSLMKSFTVLKESINRISSLSDLSPIQYLSPFLDVIRSEQTSGTLTCLGLSAVHKFLSYGFIDVKSSCASVAAENIADAVTHARFMGTDTSCDEVVLMKIVEVLRLLLLSPLGTLLTNESVCELVQSFFRICFETRFSEILRQLGESALVDTVQLLFSRLPQFTEDFGITTENKLKLRPVDFTKGSFYRRRRLLHLTDRIFHHRSNAEILDSKILVSSESKISGVLYQPEASIKGSLENLTTPVSKYPAEHVIENQAAVIIGNQTSVVTENQTTYEKQALLTTENQTLLTSKNHTEDDSENRAVRITENQAVHMTENQAVHMTENQAVHMTENQAVHMTENQSLFATENDTTLTPEIEVVSLVLPDETESLNSESLSLTNFSISEAENIISVCEPDSDFPDETSSTQCEATDQGEEFEVVSIEDTEISSISEDTTDSIAVNDGEYINPRGIRFTPSTASLIPYGLPCVKEILKFLVSLINPQDQRNTEQTIQIGLNLLTIAFESGVDYFGKFGSLLVYIQDDMCKNLLSLLATGYLTVFSLCLKISFLLFEALRTHLKFQLEMFLMKLMEIIISECPKTLYEKQQMSLDFITQLWRIPSLVTELFINYDCDLHCSNLFEDLTKLMSKNAYPLAELYSVHLLSLDALLAVVESIENNCRCRMLSEKKPLEKGLNFRESSGSPHFGKTSPMQQGSPGHLRNQQLVNNVDVSSELRLSKNTMKKSLSIKPNRMKVSSELPNHEELMAIKHRKKILASGIEQFNSRPSKGISFLQNHELLKVPFDPQEIAIFLRSNPQLDKKMIGDYLSRGKNVKVLEAFVRSFAFENARIDEALRQYLETFRLPGEAPLISLIMEHFAEHWHKSNNEPFASSDAAFTLAYAVIMLNVDQHNFNARKQNIPMTLEDFKKNLKNVNGGKDFDDDMLEKIYSSIRSEEIVMPAEQTGIVRENYLWKVLLHRGHKEEGKFIHTPNGIFDHDMFSLAWGPTVAALSFIFDKSTNTNSCRRTIVGFHKCATIAAHYKMCEVFDSIMISLCKFTSLVNLTENPQNMAITFGHNRKAQMALKAAFRMANLHRDILREGWKNLLDCILHLFNAKLLPQELVEAEDFLNPNGVISLIREDSSIPRIESGIFSSFYSYITSEAPSQRLFTPEDEAAKQKAYDCIKECHCEQLITESKFFEVESLQELVKTLIFLCHCPEPNATPNNFTFDEDSTVFTLELIVKIVLLNRDRVLTIWADVQEHLFCLVMNSAITENTYLLERSVVGILRIAVRLVRKEEMIPQVLHSLQGLLFLKSPSLLLVSRQIAYALHELLRTNAANIHLKEHWAVIFSLLERVGAGAKLTQKSSFSSDQPNNSHGVSESSGAQSDSECGKSCHESDITSDTGYVSDCELYEQGDSQSITHPSQHIPKQTLRHSENVYTQATQNTMTKEETADKCHKSSSSANQYTLTFHPKLLPHDSLAFLKSFKSLAFLVQGVAHITAENFESCVHCIQMFSEASANGGYACQKKHVKMRSGKEQKWIRSSLKRKEERTKGSHSQPNKVSESYDDDDEIERHNSLSSAYQQVSLQLLDMMYTLHMRAFSVFGSLRNQPEITNDLWNNCWCPLLQGIARLCCDTRRPIRTSALNLLPRALLSHDLQTLSPKEWESCFNKVLFPLLAKLLDDIIPNDPVGMEETRMRAATLLCKVFLQHLTPLLELSSFTALWITILDFMAAYIQADKSGLLAEAIPELLKNMLLVMNTASIFKKPENNPTTEKDRMWHITWDRINSFLPALHKELLKSPESPPVTVKGDGRPSHEVRKISQESEESTIILCENAEENNSGHQGQVSASSSSTCKSISAENVLPATASVPLILHSETSHLTYSSPSLSDPDCTQLATAVVLTPDLTVFSDLTK